MQKRILFFLIVTAIVAGASGQVRKPFQPRTSQYSPNKATYTIKGDFTVLGNANLLLEPYTDDYGNNNTGNFGCTIRPMKYVDVDGDASTINSSSAQLVFPTENGCNPACTEVVYAGLYWMSRAEPALYGKSTYRDNTTIGVDNEVLDGKFRITQALDGNYNVYTITRISSNQVVRQIRVHTGQIQIQTRNGASGTWTTQPSSESATNYPGNIQSANYTIKYASGSGTTTVGDRRWWTGHDWSHNESAFNFSADGVTYYIYGISRKFGLYIAKDTGTELTLNGHTMYKNKIKFKHQSESAYTTVTATTSEIMYPTADTSWNGNYFINIGYAEVTDYVRAHGEGNYFGADIALSEGPEFQVGYCGGWGLVVVYQNEDMKWRNITLFDGYASVSAGNYPLINVEGFEANPAGDVAVKVAMMAAEGDRGMTGDRCRMLRAGKTEITTNENTYFELSHPKNSPTNFFNGSIYTNNTRNPTQDNNCGMDISMVTLDNSNKQYIQNGQTSTQFQYTCASVSGAAADIYVPWFFGISIQCYVPEPEAFNAFVQVEGAHFDETENAYVVRPGDSISFLIDIRNRGTESVRDAVIQVPIPKTASLATPHSFAFMAPERSGSTEFDATAGSNGTAIWHLDRIPAGYPDSVYATLRLDFVLTEDCYELMSDNEDCKLELMVDGILTAIGELSNVPVNASTFVVGYEGGGQCKGELVRHPIRVLLDRQAYLDEGHCIGDYTVRVLELCTEPASPNTIDFMDVYTYYPSGTRFFNTYPITESTVEYTHATGFPLPTSGVLNVIAVTNTSNAACYTHLRLEKTTELQTPPTVTPGETTIHYCVNETAQPLSTHVTATPGYTLYFYRTPNGAAETDIVPATDEPGTYTYYVRQGTENCISNAVTITVVVHSPATLSTSLTNDEACAGNSFTVTATGASGNYSWNSEYNGFASQSGKVLTISSGAPAGTLNVTYTVTGSSEYCESGATISKIITINPATVAGHIEPPTTQLCQNGSFSDLVLHDYVGEVVKWEYRTGTSGAWKTIYNTTDHLSADMVNTITTTTYFRATVKSGNCGEQITPAVSVTPNTSVAPNAPKMPTPQYACPNTTYTIAVGSNPVTRLRWYATESSGSPDASLRTVQMGTSSVTRYVSIVDNSGACESKRTVVSVLPKFNAGSIIDGKLVTCIGSAAPTIQNSFPAESYQDGVSAIYSWTVTSVGGTETTIDGATDASYSVPASYMDHEGSYTFRRYAQVTGCPEDPSVGEYKLTVVDCDAEYTEEMCPLKDDYPYAPFDTTFKTGTVSGDYVHHGSKVVDGVTIDTTALLHLTIWDEYESSDALSVCLYEDTYTQTYSKNEYVTITTTTSGVTVTSSSSTVVIDATDAVNGNFLLKMKTIHGCDSIISLHVDYDIVKRDTVYKDTLYAGTPYTMEFSNKVFYVDHSGTYTKVDTIPGSNGCDSITTRVLIVEPLHKDTICQSEFATYTWRGNTLPASTDSHGYYEFPGWKIIDGTVVDTISYLLLTINPNPVVEVTSLSDLCPNVGFGALTATITTATVANYTFVWKGDLNTIPTTTTTPYLTNETAVAIPAPPASCGKTYYDTVTVTDANGCSAMARATVSVKTPATPTIAAKTGIHDDDLGCNPSTFVLTYENFTVTDECNGAAQAVVTPSTVVESGCGRTQTWTANYTNACGASASPVVITYTWTVDLTAPTILLKTGSEANGHNWGCNPTVVPPAFTVSDNCAGEFALPTDSIIDGGVVNTSVCGRSQTWTAHYTDPCKNKATDVSVTYTWIEDTEIPVIHTEAVSDHKGCNPTIVAPTFTVVDNCEGTFALSADSVTTTGKTGSGCEKTQSWTAHYTDGCGNPAAPQTVTYSWKEDTQKPVINTTATDSYLGCDPTTITPPTFSVSDNCEGNFALPTDSVTDGGVVAVTGEPHKFSRTWTAHFTDLCGNKADNVSITYTWVEAPTVTISCPPDVNKTLAYGDCVMNIYPAEIGTPTVNAPADWPMTVSNDIPADDLYQEGETIITWVATDGICGYSVSCQQKVIVVFPQCPDAVDCEGNVYHGVRIDCDCWTQTNLQSNYYGDPGVCEEEIPCKYTYDANAAAEYGIDILNDNFGRLYCPEAGLKDSADNGHGHIRGICPKGWYLPTPEKYEALNLHGADALKSPLYWTDGGGNNSTEFTWLPAGWWNGALQRFEGLTSEGYFLSTKIVAGEISTHVHVIVHDCDVVKEIEVNSGYGYSVRCIKEKD